LVVLRIVAATAAEDDAVLVFVSVHVPVAVTVVMRMSMRGIMTVASICAGLRFERLELANHR
jgi:hypothetical protein